MQAKQEKEWEKQQSRQKLAGAERILGSETLAIRCSQDYSGSHYPTSVPTAFIPGPVRDMPGDQQRDRMLFPGKGPTYRKDW
jgi:hypothetical protein